MTGRYRCFSSSPPKFITGSMPSLEISNVTAVEAHARATSSIATAWVTRSAPWPPYSVGAHNAGSSMSTQARKLSQGYSSRSS